MRAGFPAWISPLFNEQKCRGISNGKPQYPLLVAAGVSVRHSFDTAKHTRLLPA